MISLLKGVVGFMAMILVSIGTYWVIGVNEDRAIIHELKAKDKYLHGDLVVPVEAKK
jgi:hypothetical protein